MMAAQAHGLGLICVQVGRGLKAGEDDEALVIEGVRVVGVEVVLGEAQEVVAVRAEGRDGLRGGEAAVGVGGVAVQVALVAAAAGGEEDLV